MSTTSRGARGPRARGLGPGELRALQEERDFLLNSIDDLDREYEAGDLDDDDYRELREDYTARAAEAVRAVRHRRKELASATRRSSKKRVVAGSMAALLFAVIAGVLVAQFSGGRQAGEQITGNLPVSQGQGTVEAAATSQPDAATQDCMAKMAKAFPGTNGGTATVNPVDVLKCFDAVLKKNPNNVAALTYRGWTGVQLALELSNSDAASSSEVGTVVQSASKNLAKAVQLAPKDPMALIYSAINAYYLQQYAKATSLLDRFDALDLPNNKAVKLMKTNLVAPLRKDLEAKASSSSSTTAPTTTAPTAAP